VFAPLPRTAGGELEQAVADHRPDPFFIEDAVTETVTATGVYGASSRSGPL